MRLVLNPKAIAAIHAKLAVFYNEASHAPIVHQGGQSRADGTVTPSRPYMIAAIENLPIQSIFASEYRQTKSIDKAFESTSEIVHNEMLSQIESPIWEWDRTTRRSSGETVSSPRNIVDSESLLDSQRFKVIR